MSNKKRLFWFGIGLVLGSFLALALARCAHAERLMVNSSKNGNVLVMSETEWVDMIKHVMDTGEMEISGTTIYYYKKYYLGTATPPHQTMPYDFFVTMIVLPPWSSQPGVLVSLKYSRDMGDGFRGHILLYMMDNNFNMVPDEIIRRTVVTRNLQIHISGNGINKDTYMFNNKIPTDRNEWNEWVAWLKTKFKQEGDSNVLEDPDSDSYTGPNNSNGQLSVYDGRLR